MEATLVGAAVADERPYAPNRRWSPGRRSPSTEPAALELLGDFVALLRTAFDANPALTLHHVAVECGRRPHTVWRWFASTPHNQQLPSWVALAPLAKILGLEQTMLERRWMAVDAARREALQARAKRARQLVDELTLRSPDAAEAIAGLIAEAHDLEAQVEEYRRRYGDLPEGATS